MIETLTSIAIFSYLSYTCGSWNKKSRKLDGLFLELSKDDDGHIVSTIGQADLIPAVTRLTSAQGDDYPHRTKTGTITPVGDDKLVSPAAAKSADPSDSKQTDPTMEEESLPYWHVNQEQLVVNDARVVVAPKRFMRACIMETKARFGTPERNAANRLAVRKHLLDIMNRHGVRPTHVQRYIGICVVMVFADNEADLVAEDLEQCEAYQLGLREWREERGFWRWVRRTWRSVVGAPAPQWAA